MPYHNRDPKGTLIWEFPKIRGYRIWGSYYKDPTISGTTPGSAVFGNSHIDNHPNANTGGTLGVRETRTAIQPPPPPKPQSSQLTQSPKQNLPPPKKKKKREAVRLSICSLTSTLWAKVQDVPLAQQFLACSSSRTRPCFSLRIGVHENHRLRSKPQTLT